MMHLFRTMAIALLASTLLVSCGDEEDPIIVNDNNYYVQFVINGDTIRYADGTNGYGNGPGKTANEDSLGWNQREFTMFIRSADSADFENNAINIQIVKRFVITPTYQERYDMFSPASLGYGSWPADTSHFLTEGAIITYTDNNGTVWTSDLLYGTQPSSSNFTITEHTTVDAALFGAKTRGTFNVRLYDGATDHIDLTDGKFYARTVNSQ
jgi:hypothetical protein